MVRRLLTRSLTFVQEFDHYLVKRRSKIVVSTRFTLSVTLGKGDLKCSFDSRSHLEGQHRNVFYRSGERGYKPDIFNKKSSL